MTKTKIKPKLEPQDPLDALATGPVEDVLAMMLWKVRHQHPDLSMQFTPKDLTGYAQCVEYQKATPEVRVFRPQGIPAQEAIPAQGNRRAVPARPAMPPRDFVVVSLVHQGTEDAIRVVENNEEDNERRKAAEHLASVKAQVPDLAARLERYARSGELVGSDLLEASRWLRIMVATAA